MARAAVKAKQAQQAQAQAAARPSRKRKHAAGGNPNQDLFFSRLRRRQKWVFLTLAIVFAVSFAALGVGSGNGGGLDQIFNGILGGNSDAVGKAEAEIKTNPAKGYRDLANAYVTKDDLPNAIRALQSYLAIKKKDAQQWTILGTYQKQQADTFSSQYQQVLQATKLESPGSVLQPTGTLGTSLGTNPIDEYYTKQNQAISGPLYQNAITAYTDSLASFKNAAKYTRGKQERAAAEYAVFTAASQLGDKPTMLTALRKFVALNPASPLVKQVQKICKQLGSSCALHSKKK
jgi:tetratricopeptide (TPR) repeat protein